MSLRSKKACIAPLVLIALFEVRADQQEGSLDVFLGKGKYEVQGLFADERNPNPVVAREGTVVASWLLQEEGTGDGKLPGWVKR